MNDGDYLARIAEGQIGTRGDLQSGRAALYGYLLATNAKLAAFEPQWAHTGFGSNTVSRYRLLNVNTEAESTSRLGLLDKQPSSPELEWILRIHSWCAAFVDWCVMQLLMQSSHATSLTLTQRPKTASAFELLHWGKANNCTVFDGNQNSFDGNQNSPARGDIAVFKWSHTGIVVQSGAGHFVSVEGNTTKNEGGNQGYLVERRVRSGSQLKGLIRLPSRCRPGDYNISSKISRTA